MRIKIIRETDLEDVHVTVRTVGTSVWISTERKSIARALARQIADNIASDNSDNASDSADKPAPEPAIGFHADS